MGVFDAWIFSFMTTNGMRWDAMRLSMAAWPMELCELQAQLSSGCPCMLIRALCRVNTKTMALLLATHGTVQAMGHVSLMWVCCPDKWRFSATVRQCKMAQLQVEMRYLVRCACFGIPIAWYKAEFLDFPENR